MRTSAWRILLGPIPIKIVRFQVGRRGNLIRDGSDQDGPWPRFSASASSRNSFSRGLPVRQIRAGLPGLRIRAVKLDRWLLGLE